MPLTAETVIRIEALFPPEFRAEASKMLEERCGTNLPFLSNRNAVELERFRFAALKLSQGNIAKLQSAIELANLDWRDLLVAAEFANDIYAHKAWSPKSA